ADRDRRRQPFARSVNRSSSRVHLRSNGRQPKLFRTEVRAVTSMLRIRVLGELAVERDGRPVVLPAGRRIRSLRAWLAMHPGPHPRARLAATFWPEVPDANARASLRSAVWALRAVLGEPAGDCLRTTRDTVELGGELRVDVTEFDRLRAGDPA